MFFFNYIKNLINRKKLKNIELVVLDVDGVLTDGKLSYCEDGSDFKNFNVKDGLGIKLLQKEKIKVVFISGNNTLSTIRRAKDLSIDKCFVGISNKLEIIREVQKEFNVKKDCTLFCGDDLNDLVLIDEVNIFVCPLDASSNIKSYSNIVLKKKGGYGAVRELCEMILKEKIFLSKYLSKGFAEKN